jgi:hypothetical protein
MTHSTEAERCQTRRELCSERARLSGTDTWIPEVRDGVASGEAAVGCEVWKRQFTALLGNAPAVGRLIRRDSRARGDRERDANARRIQLGIRSSRVCRLVATGSS